MCGFRIYLLSLWEFFRHIDLTIMAAVAAAAQERHVVYLLLGILASLCIDVQAINILTDT